MSVELANAIGRRFIARSDAKAKQHPDGEYRPVRENPRDTRSATISWTRDDILAHIAGTETFGHYFLNSDNTCKLFALDIDLEEEAKIPILPMPQEMSPNFDESNMEQWEASFTVGKPREAWRNRKYPGRNWMKVEFMTLAGLLAGIINKQLELECAVAYSGNKGLHVYGFTGRQPAHDVREGAELILQLMGGWEFVPTPYARYKHPKFPHLGIEIYPKQDQLPSGGFGNLMRLPLGRNLKSPDPTFFLDLRAPLNEMKARDPLWSLTEGAKNPWADE